MKSSFESDLAVLPIADPLPERAAFSPPRPKQAGAGRRRVDNWFLVVLLVASGTFAVTFATHVLAGAAKALTASTASWSPQGP